MITNENIKKVLEKLDFTGLNGTYFFKDFPKAGGCSVSVDFGQEKITYPETLDTGANTTTNFSQPENFVVLECVCRLLEKGYEPQTIFLEKSWTLGHTGKSGRADITVYEKDADGNPTQAYLIIECKRAGKDYKDARKEMFDDPNGKQIFSYWAQARSAKWLYLYASDYDEENNEITFTEELVRSYDDENIEKLAEKDESVLLFKNASTAQDAFIVWEETYSKKTYSTNLIFSDDAIPYKIGNLPIKNKSLKEFTEIKSATDSFREILRHNSISDKENAFNKLLSLFICKFVDEAENANPDDKMAFQYVDGSDNYYSLYERLLALFQIGMKKYLKEEVFYLENDYIRKTLDQYTGKKREELENELVDKFQKTKMLSCQVFAFREVYNEKLFLQNGKVLVEVVELFQSYRMSYTSKKQFLGDLFENLLNQGFKQEAGQFFTPIPITRFVWNSLPLDRFLDREKLSVPRVVDFACGSGHFLTEGISAVSDFYNTDKEKLAISDKEISKNFYGADKDNRLARVSKVAMLLNGANEANIMAADGLEHDENFYGGGLHSFDILVANPPYSVDSFKTHESRKVQNSYETIKLMSFSAKDIQNVFIERMHNLLKPKGVAGIVMPSSVLSNTNESDIKTREIILQNFYVRAVAQFGGKTFGETSTQTIILFLEHFDFPPQKARLLKDSVNAILSGEELSGWDDREIFAAYLDTIKVQESAYKDFILRNGTFFENAFVPYFKEYEAAFKALTDTRKKLSKIEETKAKEEAGVQLKKNEKSSAALKDDLNVDFYDFVKGIEAQKILHFALTYKETTLIITSPSDSTEQKKFLGYDFSHRRGDEGIKETGGLLTNFYDRADKTKLAHFVRSAFSGKNLESEELSKYVSYVRTSDMLNFSRPAFDLQIKLSAEKKAEVRSKFPLVKLGNVAEIQKGKAITSKELKEGNIKVVAGGIDYAYLHNEANREANIITISASGANAGYVNYWSEPIFASDCTTVRGKTEQETKFIFNVLKVHQDILFSLQKGAAQPHVYPDDIKKISIPKIDDDNIKKQIVAECEAVDVASQKAQDTVAECKKQIADLFAAADKKASTALRLSDKDIFEVSIGRRILNSEMSEKYDIPVYSANVFEPFGKINKLLITDFSVPSVIWGIDGDWQVNCIGENQPFYPTDHCGVLRIKDETRILTEYLAFCLDKEGKAAGFKRSYRASIDRIEGLTITVPPLGEQERIVREVAVLEERIAEAKRAIAECPAKKTAVLEKWL